MDDLSADDPTPSEVPPERSRSTAHLVPRVSAATWLRASRRARTLSQRELAELAGVSRGTVDRIEASRGRPAYDTVVEVLAATGYAVIAVDHCGRRLRVTDPALGLVDRGDRYLPVHLNPVRTLPWMQSGTLYHRPWWGWGSLAWWDGDPAVPAWTYHRRRRRLPHLGDRGDYDDRSADHGRVWDDAT